MAKSEKKQHGGLRIGIKAPAHRPNRYGPGVETVVVPMRVPADKKEEIKAKFEAILKTYEPAK